MVKVVGQRREPATVKLRDAISENILKVSPDESCSHCLELMKQNRCRHLLVFEGEEFVGIVSLRDLVALMLEEKEDLIGQLEKYITG
jgi:predicted transcriptional regulator